MSRTTSSDAKTGWRRGVSPVIGTALLLAIVVILAAIWAFIFIEMNKEPDPAPDVNLDLEQNRHGPGVVLYHNGGEELEGSRTTLFGTANERSLHGQLLTTNDEVQIWPTAEEVEVHWRGNNSDYILQTYTVNENFLPYAVDDINQDCEDASNSIADNGRLSLDDVGMGCEITSRIRGDASNVPVTLENDAILVGGVTTDGFVEVEESMVAGDVTSQGSSVDISEESEIHGAVTATDGGSVRVEDSTIEGHVYAESANFNCYGSTTIGPDEEDCSAYEPRDPDG